MVRLFKHYVPTPIFKQAMLDTLLLIIAAELAWIWRALQIGMDISPIWTRLIPLLSFAIVIQMAMISSGVYNNRSFISLRYAAARLLVAISMGVIFFSITYFLFPGATLWRSNSLYAMFFSITLLYSSRVILSTFMDMDNLRRPLIVLGAGQRAAEISELEKRPESSFAICTFIRMDNASENVVQNALSKSEIDNLSSHIKRHKARELVLAIEERRNALPLNQLLRAKVTGINIIDYSSFIERESGRIDLASVNPSWLIFSDGFSSPKFWTTIYKRTFDIITSLTLLLISAPVIALFALLIRLESPGPAFFRQKRVGLHGQEFEILKLRSMRSDAEADGRAVWASENDPRITRIGRFIRTFRIDEIPQSYSVLRGDMSFVGPRPERPEFVCQLIQELPYYHERHIVKPGITGWAQVNYPYGASTEDARKKLEYDLYYVKNYSMFLDILIILQTVRVIIWPSGAR